MLAAHMTISDEQHERIGDQFIKFIHYESNVNQILEYDSLNKIATELKTEKLLPELYTHDYKRLVKIIKDELFSNAQRDNPDLPGPKDLKRIVRDIIICHCNKKAYQNVRATKARVDPINTLTNKPIEKPETLRGLFG